MKYGSISTGSKEALNTAKQIFEEGGNAFDAAIAAVFTSMTSEFSLTGAGGGGILLGMEKGTNPIIYDFFVNCPESSNNNIDFEKISVDFGNTAQQFYIGKGSTAIPGNIAGLLGIHKEKGKLPLNIILEPAIDIAKNGVQLSAYQSYINTLVKPILLHTNEGKKLFMKNDKFLKENDVFKNPNFSLFLSELSQKGSDFFYKKEGAEIINKHYKVGGIINKKHLSNYKMIKREPISFKLNEYKIITNPAPSYAGTLMIFLFKLLEQTNQLDSDIITLIKAMELTSIARNEVCNNPKNEMEINKVLDDTLFNKYLDRFKNNSFNGDNTKLSGFGSTTHISIIDKDDNIASVTTTNGEGCGYFIPEFGMMMNNMLGEHDLNPYGFHKWQSIRRLPTMMCPTIILKNDKPYYILGSGGSNRIRSAITQVIINLVVKRMPLELAINEPRIHLEGNDLYCEPDINLNPKNIEHLKINTFSSKSLFFGGVNCVGPNIAFGDSRRGGVGEVF